MLLFSFAAMTKTESVYTSSLHVYGKTGLIYCNQTTYFFIAMMNNVYVELCHVSCLSLT